MYWLHQLKRQLVVNAHLDSSNTIIEKCNYADILCDVTWCDLMWLTGNIKKKYISFDANK